MQTLLHKNSTVSRDKEKELSENYFRLIGLLLMLLGIVIAMYLLDFKLFA